MSPAVVANFTLGGSSANAVPAANARPRDSIAAAARRFITVIGGSLLGGKSLFMVAARGPRGPRAATMNRLFPPRSDPPMTVMNRRAAAAMLSLGLALAAGTALADDPPKVKFATTAGDIVVEVYPDK